MAARGAQGLSWVGGCFASLAPSRVLSCSPEARRFGTARRGAAYRGAAGFSADRKALLLRTALASTLLIATVTAPAPAHAVVGCAVTPGTAIYVQADDDIVCLNIDPRPADPVAFGPIARASVSIFLQTPANPANTGPYSIYLNNSGPLTTGGASAGSLYGIYTTTGNDESPITILNSGEVTLLPIPGPIQLPPFPPTPSATIALSRSRTAPR